MNLLCHLFDIYFNCGFWWDLCAVMSSYASMSLVFKCLSKGAVDFLVKPIRKNELKNLWQHVWRRCQSVSCYNFPFQIPDFLPWTNLGVLPNYLFVDIKNKFFCFTNLSPCPVTCGQEHFFFSWLMSCSTNFSWDIIFLW